MNIDKKLFIKETKEEELPIVPGTRVTYNGTEYEASELDTGKQGWIWKVVRGKLPISGNDKILFKYDSPIYKLPRYNSRNTPQMSEPSLTHKERVVSLPPGVSSPKDAFNYAFSLNSRVPDLEYLIAKDPMIAARYANIFNFDFVLAEPGIEQNPYAAMLYATGHKKARWPKQIEEIIKTDPIAWKKYSSNFNIPEV